VNGPSYPFLHNCVQKLDGENPVLVRLELTGVIRGIATDKKSGLPLSQLRVRVASSKSLPGDPEGRVGSEWWEGVTFKRGDGKFLVGPLKDGFPVDLTIMAEGYEPTV